MSHPPAVAAASFAVAGAVVLAAGLMALWRGRSARSGPGLAGAAFLVGGWLIWVGLVPTYGAGPLRPWQADRLGTLSAPPPKTAQGWLDLAEELEGSRPLRSQAPRAAARALSAPMDDKARGRFRDLCLRSPDRRAARLLLTRLAQLRPRDLDVWLALAQLAAAADSRSEALRCLGHVRSASRDPEQLFKASVLLEKLQEPAAARTVLEAAARAAPRDARFPLRLAALAAEAGSRPQALGHLARVRSCARDPEQLYEAAALYEKLREPAAARGALDRAAGLAPKDRRSAASLAGFAKVRLRLAAMAVEKGARAEARQQLRYVVAISLDPDQLYEASLLYERLQDGAESRGVLARAAGLAPQDVKIALRSAALAAADGSGSEARRRLAQVRASARDPEQLYAAAALYEKLQEPEAARLALERAAELDAADARAPLRLAALAVAAGSRSEARRRLAQVRASARDPEQLYEAAFLYEKLHEPAAARGALERAAELAPADPKPALRLAALAVETGERSEALRRLGQVRSLARDPEPLREAAALYEKLQELRAARLALERAAQLGPDDTGAALRLAALAAQQGAPSEALPLLDRVARARAASPEQTMSAALLFQRLGRVDQAWALLDRLVRAHPDNARYLSNRGVAQALLGRKDGAMADLRSAIAKEPRLLQSYLSLGLLLEGAGRRDQALAVFKDALSVADPLDAGLVPVIKKAASRGDAP